MCQNYGYKDVKKMLEKMLKGRHVFDNFVLRPLLFQDRPWYCENLVTFWAS